MASEQRPFFISFLSVREFKLTNVHPHCRNAVLYVDELVPDKHRDSGSLDVYGYLKTLSSLGFATTFVSLFKTLSEQAKEVISFRNDFPSVRLIDSIGLKNLVEAKYEFHVIFYSRVTTFSTLYSRLKAQYSQASHVFLTVDLHHRRYFSEYESTKSDKALRLATQFEAAEFQAIRSADLTVVVNREELGYLHDRKQSSSVIWIPLLREVPGRELDFQGREMSCIFLGNFAHPPNVDAVNFLRSELWPTVFAKTGVRLLVVGSGMPEILKADSSSEIEFIGFVENLGQVFKNAICSIAPLRFGAGEKGKILTSLGFGVPVVGSKVASEGMMLSEGSGFIACDTPSDYCTEILRLVTDEHHWIKTSNAALHSATSRSSGLLTGYLASLFMAINAKKPKIRTSFTIPPLLYKEQYEPPDIATVMMTLGSDKRPSFNAKFLAIESKESSNQELLIFNVGEPHLETTDNGESLSEYLVPHWDHLERYKFMSWVCRSNYIRFVSDDDPLSTNYSRDLFNASRLLENGTLRSLISDVVFLSSSDPSLGISPPKSMTTAEKYARFVNTKISKAAFYGIYPKAIVNIWANFLYSNKILFSYDDWLLSYLAFAVGEVEFLRMTDGFTPNFFDEANWDGQEKSLETVSRVIRGKNLPSWLVIFENFFWIIDLLKISRFANENGFMPNKQILTIATSNQIARFRAEVANRRLFYRSRNEDSDLLIEKLDKIVALLLQSKVDVGVVSRAICCIAEEHFPDKFQLLCKYCSI